MGTRTIIALTALGVAGLIQLAPADAKQYVPKASQELAPRSLDSANLAIPHRLSFWPSINWSKLANNRTDDWLME